MILEQLMTGTVIGSLPGLAGNGPRIIFRILRVFEFGNGLISRENVWLDMPAIVNQLTVTTRRKVVVRQRHPGWRADQPSQ